MLGRTGVRAWLQKISRIGSLETARTQFLLQLWYLCSKHNISSHQRSFLTISSFYTSPTKLTKEAVGPSGIGLRIAAIPVQQNGSGSISYSDGTTLRGEFRDGAFHEGCAWRRSRNGLLQEENWIDGQRCVGASQIVYEDGPTLKLLDSTLTGHGVLKLPCGVYTGQFLGTYQHGQGVLTYNDGRKLSGEWKAGTLHNGSGVQIHTDRTYEYEGPIQDGQWHGQGTLTHADGTTLQGRFVKGRLYRGRGTLKMPSGDVYEGEIRSYKRHGQGKLTRKDGNVLQGEFREGKIYNGQGVQRLPSGDIYAGHWVQGAWEGEGKLTHTTGEVLQGQWKQGKMYNGSGTLRHKDWLTMTGEWKDGRFRGAVTEKWR